MAIAFDTSTNGGSVTAATSLTFSHPCTGNDLILFVGAKTSTNGDFVTGITYAGDPMTRIDLRQPGTGYIYLYYKIAPATGANNVVISVSPAKDIKGVAASYTGAKQSGVPDASVTNAASAVTSITGTLTTVADNAWSVTIGGLVDTSTNTLSLGSGGIARQINTLIGIADSTVPKTPPGSYSMVWNSSASDEMALVMASFAPAPPAGGGGLYTLL